MKSNLSKKIVQTQFLILTTFAIIFPGALSYAQESLDGDWEACNVYPDSSYVRFKNDTVFYNLPFIGWDDFSAVSTYSLSEDTIFWNDLSECDLDTGIYLYHIEEDTLSFTEIQDDCANRLKVLEELKLKKIQLVNTLDMNSIPFSVFPNPFRDELRIEVSEPTNYDYQLFNSLGKIVKAGAGIGSQRINLNDLHKGLYFLIIRNRERQNISSIQIIKV